MDGPLRVGGAPVVTLTAQDAPASGLAFVEAQVLPGRGMMLLQARLRLPSGEVTDAIHAPPPAEAAKALDGGPDDFNGNKSFSFGGAILAPFANRIRGRALPDTREIETEIDGYALRLPRNWGGKADGAEQYAMHGLILDAEVSFEQTAPDRVTGRLDAADFSGHWPGRLAFDFEWRLEGGVLALQVGVENTGMTPCPVGVGWHPYFNLRSGDRRQAKLRLPALRRTEVNDYDEVLPTGRMLPVVGTDYDFNAARPLGELYLDDCFVGLGREGGSAVAEIHDRAAELGLRIASDSPAVSAFQVYAPPDKPFVVVEPQYNLADPFGAEWPADLDTGMVWLQPGETTSYSVRVSAFALGTA